jgi:cell division inhibitor SepF
MKLGWLNNNDETENVEEEYYNTNLKDAMDNGEASKMILLEPRAFSESRQIVEFLKNRNTVVVNLKRVTSAQAKRIIDFTSGAVEALGGSISKVGSGTFLCTPRSMSVQGKITEDSDKNGEDKDEDGEW